MAASGSGGEPLRDDAEAQAEAAPAEEPEAPVDLEKMWLEYKDNHNFFKQIELAKDGGMSEASELLGPQRYIFGAMPIGYVLMNIYSILTVNLTYLFSVGQTEDPGTNATDSDVFLVTRHFILDPLGLAEGIPGGGAGVIAILEIFALGYYLMRCVYWLCRIRCPGEHEYSRWQAVQEFFWNALPEASTISAVKLLNYVTPQVLMPSLFQVFSKSGILVNLPIFLISRSVAGLVGFDSLLFKLQVISGQIQTQISSGNPDVFGLLITCLTFLSQILGIVQVGWFVRKRIFAFIFAGEDGTLSPEEEAVKETWESMLAERIWRELSWHQALAAYLSYSDYDFQKLALETVKPGHAEKKQAKKQGTGSMDLAANS